MRHIANHRFVVVGCERGGVVQPIHATDDLLDAERILSRGRTIDEKHWAGLRIHDRRHSLFIQLDGSVRGAR